MAKGKKVNPVDVLEQAIRKAIDDCQVLQGMSERKHFETIDEALDLISDGVRMRLGEMDEEDGEE